MIKLRDVLKKLRSTNPVSLYIYYYAHVFINGFNANLVAPFCRYQASKARRDSFKLHSDHFLLYSGESKVTI